MEPQPPTTPVSGPDVAGARWLHDKYERLLSTEEERVERWASLFIGLETGLAALMGSIYSLFGRSSTFFVLAYLAFVGAGLSAVWAMVARRVQRSRHFWREALLAIERGYRLTEATFRGEVAPYWLRPDNPNVDLSRPFSEYDTTVRPGDPLSGIGPFNVLTKAPVFLALVWLFLAIALFLLS